MILSQPVGPTQKSATLLLLVGMAATVGTAIGFERIGGYIPCMLCLQQRIPYYVGIPLMLAAALCIRMQGPAWLTRLLLLTGALLMTVGLGLGIYHSGVEWGWWPGPASCGAVSAPAGSGNGILEQLNTLIPPSCDEAAGRFLGLSFAGWNVLASAALAAIGYRAALGR